MREPKKKAQFAFVLAIAGIVILAWLAGWAMLPLAAWIFYWAFGSGVHQASLEAKVLLERNMASILANKAQLDAIGLRLYQAEAAGRVARSMPVGPVN